MKTYDVYGFGGLEVHEVKDVVQSVLGIAFQERDSTYIPSPYYKFLDNQGEEISVQANYDKYENEWIEEAFREHIVLVYVNTNSLRADSIKDTLLGNSGKVKHIKREII